MSNELDKRDRLCCVIVQEIDDEGFLVEDRFVVKSGRLVSGTFWHTTKKYSKSHREWESRVYSQLRHAVRIAKSMNDHGVHNCPRCDGPRPTDDKYRDHCPGCHKELPKARMDMRRKHEKPVIGWRDGRPLYAELPE